MPSLSDVNLNRLLVFITVVEAGSLSAAARQLALTKTMVSTHLQRLEAELGTSLLRRTTRRQELTDAGETFYAASRQIVHDAEEAIAVASQNTAEPRGTLRITAPIDYGATVVAPVAVALGQRYPALKIELLVGDRLFDLVAERIDVAIRVGKLATDSSDQASRIGSFSDWLVASPAALKKIPMPEKPDDLTAHPFIALSVLPQPLSWTFSTSENKRQTIRFESAISANTAHAVRSAALAGGGLAILPDFAVAADVDAGRLIRVIPEWSLPDGGIFAVLPASRHRPKKISAFIDALRLHVRRATKFLD